MAAYGQSDSYLIDNVLPADIASTCFTALKNEAEWQTMLHRGGEVPRLVATQGKVEPDGSIPIYRHPADVIPELKPWSPTVEAIKTIVEAKLNQPLNHVLIQYYRSGEDYISEHSDKTLDVVKDTSIVNLSLGAQRTMVLRTKKSRGEERTTQRIPLPHNSLFVMGPRTNESWLHGIRQDRRIIVDKSPEEMLEAGERISLTFRTIGTWKTPDGRIYGQGATGKTIENAHPMLNEKEQTVKMLQAFSAENHASTFDWDAHYGAGFDVIDCSAATERDQ